MHQDQPKWNDPKIGPREPVNLVNAVIGGEGSLKLIEDALYRQGGNLQRAIDSANVGIEIIDAAGQIIFVNRRLADMLRLSRSDLQGKPGFFYASDRNLLSSKGIFGPDGGGERFSGIISYDRGDGHSGRTHISVNPIIDSGRNFLGYLVFHIDMTEHQLVEEMLRAREAKLESIFRAAPVGIGISVNRIMKEANTWLCKMLGYTHDEIIDMNARAFYLNDEDYTSVGREIFREKGPSGVGAIETRWVRKDGAILDVLLSFTLIEPENPGAGVTFIAADITDRKQSEERLERANRALKALSKCSEALVHTNDETALLREVCQIIVGVGGYRLAWIGYALDDPAKSVRPVACDGYDEGYLDTVDVTWAGTDRGLGPTGTAIRTGAHHIVRYVRDDTKFSPWRSAALERGYASVIGLPLRNDRAAFGALTIYSEKPDTFDPEEVELLTELADNLAYGIVALRDRTQRNIAEKALEDARDQAELYVDLMGHDINNLNQVGIGYLEIALDTLSLDDIGRSLISHPLMALEGSSQIIKNVKKLQMVKSGGVRQKEIDLGQVLASVRDHYDHLHGGNITIVCPPVTGCFVMANELLYDVFANLVGNAIKHASGRPVISVSVEKVFEGDRRLCRVAVEDNGPGIPDDLKFRIFNRHLRGDTKAKGSGIGLFLVRTLVEDYGGRVWVEDRVPGDRSRGSRFLVQLPATGK
jgi:PAS domain S-box-containing protein